MALACRANRMTRDTPSYRPADELMLKRDDGPELILGTAQLVAAYGISSNRPRRTIAEGVCLLRHAHRAGVRRLDTAAAYDGAELAIGACELAFVVDTKITGSSPPSEQIERSLGRLQRRELGVVYLHDPARLHEEETTYLDAAATAAASVGARLGASIYTPHELTHAMERDAIAAVQLPANLLDRRVSPALRERAASRDKLLFVRSVFLQGALLSDPEALEGRVAGLGAYVAQIARLAAELGRSRTELALQWVRSLSHITGVVVGVDSEDHLKQLIAAWSQPRLSSDEVDRIHQLPPAPDHIVDPRSW